MTALRWARRVVTAAVALAVLLTVVSTTGGTETRVVPAADLSAFRPGNIISDAVFYDSASMSAGQIQAFLNGQGADCAAANGVACLKDYAMGTPTRTADQYCAQYTGAAREVAAQIIAKVARACDINPRVLLVTLQKEQGSVTTSTPVVDDYRKAMGFACPDSPGGCDAYYNGFFNQLYNAAKQFQRYTAKPGGYGYEAGIVNQIKWHPNSACGTSSVLIENQATANLYNYTPYRPNEAALRAGYGKGDGCSSYGNRNFWNYFTDWFGSTQTGGYDPDKPVGSLDLVSGRPDAVYVRGWVYDPNVPTSPGKVHVYVDGALAGAVATSVPRPDVAAAIPGVGPNQGYAAVLPAAAGTRTVCVYAINVGKGYSNPRLGCQTVTITRPADWNPVGTFDPPVTSGLDVEVSGWALDPDQPSAPTTVHVYVDGARTASMTAGLADAGVASAYPAAGEDHGYRWTGTLTAGSHTICVYAINVGTGTGNPRLGCETVSVAAPPPPFPPGNPRGNLDSLTLSGTTVSARGWVFDPDNPTAPVSVHVYVDGARVATVSAAGARPDIGRIYPAAGSNHGFSWSGTLSAGTHTVCLYAINMGAGTGNPRLGCKSLGTAAPAAAFPPGNPWGSLDAVTAAGTSVTARGWAIDPDQPTTPVTVHIYVDGRSTAAVAANRPRADIGRIYPAAGSNHGYGWTGTLASGAHTVCAYAINRGAGTGNPRLGCKAVTVP